MVVVVATWWRGVCPLKTITRTHFLSMRGINQSVSQSQPLKTEKQ